MKVQKKAGKKEIVESKKAMVSEHKHLSKVLNKAAKKAKMPELAKEAEKQRKELKTYERA